MMTGVRSDSVYGGGNKNIRNRSVERNATKRSRAKQCERV